MKPERIYLIIVFFFSINSFLFSQDTIVLKNGNKILAFVIQMDVINTYYREWKGTNNEIKSIRNDNVSEIFMNGYSDIYNNKKKRHAKKNSEIKQEKGHKKQRMFGININVLPSIDVSLNIDVNEFLNLEIGKGIGLFYMGSKFFVEDRTKRNRLYIGSFIYRIRFFSYEGLFAYVPIGLNFRSKYGIELKAELGLFANDNKIFPMFRIGGGFRF